MIRASAPPDPKAPARPNMPPGDPTTPILLEVGPLPRWIMRDGQQRAFPGRPATGAPFRADGDPDEEPLGHPARRTSAAGQGRAAEAASGTALGAAFQAGAALAALDQLVRADAPWLGVFRMRQALAAAAATARLLRLRDDAASLRDAHHLTRPGGDPGPGGRLFRAWRDLANRPARLGPAIVARLAGEYGLALDVEAILARGQACGPMGAAAAAAADIAAGCENPVAPETETIALMAADLALAQNLGWREPVPLFATALADPALRLGPEGRRIRPGEPGWMFASCLGYGRSAARAHASALDLARRAARLERAARVLRTRGSEKAIAALLSEDAVSATSLGLGSERAARRGLDRLVALGGIRELTGRATFRLYGL